MKNQVKIRTLFLVLVFMIFSTTISLADNDYSCNVDLVSNKNTMNAGDSVIYEVRVSNINAETGIIIFESYISYDADTFECAVYGDDNEEWSKTSFIENRLTMQRTSLEPSTADQTVAKLVFTAKSDASAGSKNIQLTGIRFTMEGDKAFQIGDITTTIEIASSNSGNNNNNKNNNNNNNQNANIPNNVNNGETQNNNSNVLINTPTVVNNSNNNANNNSNNQNRYAVNQNKNNESVTNIPQTGTNDVIKIVLLFLAIVLAVFFYEKYYKWKGI
ncbi:MAG: hypothetical protein IKG56_03760 [Clostridia bacterium]|nr:hypothetical protein [Clostridia bacterium]